MSHQDLLKGVQHYHKTRQYLSDRNLFHERLEKCMEDISSASLLMKEKRARKTFGRCLKDMPEASFAMKEKRANRVFKTCLPPLIQEASYRTARREEKRIVHVELCKTAQLLNKMREIRRELVRTSLPEAWRIRFLMEKTRLDKNEALKTMMRVIVVREATLYRISHYNHVHEHLMAEILLYPQEKARILAEKKAKAAIRAEKEIYAMVFGVSVVLFWWMVSVVVYGVAQTCTYLIRGCMEKMMTSVRDQFVCLEKSYQDPFAMSRKQRRLQRRREIKMSKKYMMKRIML